MGRKSKRKKRDDSSSESSPSNSISSMIQTPTENKQLDEISSKLFNSYSDTRSLYIC